MKLQSSPTVEYTAPEQEPAREAPAARPRGRVVLLAILVTMALAAVIWINAARRPAPASGGLDGCLADASGQPVQAVVRVGDLERRAGADGCFFFASLPAEPAELLVEASGQRWSFAVTVEPGKAVGLGTLELR